ncbi:MAG: hypothetical protein ACJAQ6_001025 [Arenicella sp.]|jgi:hypothetical protein
MKVSSLLRLAIASLAFVSVTANAITLKELASSSQVDDGFVDILYDTKSGKTYLKIDNLNDDFIYQTSLPSGLGSNDIGLDRGQLGNTSLVAFERAGNKVFLKQKPTAFRAITDNKKEAQAISEAFASSVLWGFAIEDSGSDGSIDWVLVDASEFILQDIHGVGRILSEQKQGKGYTVDATRSAVDLPRTKAFPDNTELQATITLVGSEPGNFVKETAPNPYSISLKMHHSFVRLPDDGYQARPYIAKSGFWDVSYRDYARAINQNIEVKVIGRHRLQKKDPSAVLSEAIEPIIYYVDPGVPEPIRSALIDGAGWWNQGFEAIGFKDAFQVKMLPEGADPMDVRYNVIQWVHRSTRGWSYGYGVTDPRNGEIIKGHVTLGSLRVRQDYLIAQGLMAPFAEDQNDQPLMDLALARIRQLSAHEVGHTIGVAHNFAASNDDHSSVMDYPHPQFEIDPNNAQRIIAPDAYSVGLGKWDKAVIAYGYSEFSEAQDELVELNAMIAQNDANGLRYISDADARSVGDAHAYASLWDNGADAVDELKKMIEIRQIALNNFGSHNLKRGRNWSDLEEILVPVYYFHRFQIQAAAKWLGGVDYDYSTKGEVASAPMLEVVSAAKQHIAIDVMLETLNPEFLALPQKLVAMMVPKASNNYRTRESVNGETGVTLDQLSMASASAQHTLNALLHPQRLARLLQQHATDQKQPSITDLTDALHSTVIDKRHAGMKARLHQSVVDLIYSNYINLLASETTPKLVKVEILAALEKEQRLLSKKSSKPGLGYSGFYAYQLKRLEGASIDDDGDQIGLPEMPPGSPI